MSRRGSPIQNSRSAGVASPMGPAENIGDLVTLPSAVRSHGPSTAPDSTRDGSSTGTLRYGDVPPNLSGTTHYSGPGYVSPSPRRDGRPLAPSNPPSRPGSAYGGSHNDPPHAQQTTPPSLSSESSVTPNIRFDRLEGVIPADQLAELRRLISHSRLQRRELISAGSAITELRNEAHNVRTSAESLTGRVDRVLHDTIQVVRDGDVVISSIGRVFDEPTLGTDNIGPSGITPKHTLPEMSATDNVAGGQVHSDLSNTIPREASHLMDIRAPRNEPDNNRESRRILDDMHRELPPRRADEDGIQFWNRYHVH